MSESRIELNDSVVDIVGKMSDGNPGAINAMIMLESLDLKIDPDSAFKNLSGLISLDSYKIYGSSIYILFNDQCGRNAHKLYVLLRATQMGIFSAKRLKDIAADQMRSDIIKKDEWFNIVEKLNHVLPNLNTNY